MINLDDEMFNLIEDKEHNYNSIKILKYIRLDGLILEYIDDKYKNRFITTEAIKQNALAYRYVSDYYKNLKDIVEMACKQNGLALEHVPILKKDDNLCKIAITQNGLALEHASEKVKDDKDIVMIAVTQNGLALEHASEKVKDEKDIVMIAVTQNGLALEHASEKLKGDRDIVNAALRQNWLAFKYLLDSTKNKFIKSHYMGLDFYQNETDLETIDLENVTNMNVKNTSNKTDKKIKYVELIYEYSTDELKENINFIEEILKSTLKPLEKMTDVKKIDPKLMEIIKNNIVLVTLIFNKEKFDKLREQKQSEGWNSDYFTRFITHPIERIKSIFMSNYETSKKYLDTLYRFIEEKQQPAIDEKQQPATDKEQQPATDEQQQPATDKKQQPATNEQQQPADDDDDLYAKKYKKYKNKYNNMKKL
jgi:hypothetical protein